jgi:hypothetical protein
MQAGSFYLNAQVTRYGKAAGQFSKSHLNRKPAGLESSYGRSTDENQMKLFERRQLAGGFQGQGLPELRPD